MSSVIEIREAESTPGRTVLIGDTSGLGVQVHRGPTGPSNSKTLDATFVFAFGLTPIAEGGGGQIDPC